MSYDLHFRPRGRAPSASALALHFRNRPHYRLTDKQAWYENKNTGVYFVFDISQTHGQANADAHPVSLNLNYFRPSFFGMEAEPEVAALVAAFDLTVIDPQIDGMGTGPYRADLFLRGWNAGNEVAYQTLLNTPGHIESVRFAPTAKLMQAWHWNRQVDRRQAELGEGFFVPKVNFFEVDGRMVSCAYWPDDALIAIPVVDFFVIARHRFAPIKNFQRTDDQVLLPYAEALPFLNTHTRLLEDKTAVLDYGTSPDVARTFIQSLRSNNPPMGRIAASNVLDKELAEKVGVPLPTEPRPPSAVPQKPAPSAQPSTARPGHAPGAPFKKAGVLRNDPCPCGSGLKYKACHGAL